MCSGDKLLPAPPGGIKILKEDLNFEFHFSKKSEGKLKFLENLSKFNYAPRRGFLISYSKIRETGEQCCFSKNQDKTICSFCFSELMFLCVQQKNKSHDIHKKAESVLSDAKETDGVWWTL